jgi:hypothetical protein
MSGTEKSSSPTTPTELLDEAPLSDEIYKGYLVWDGERDKLFRVVYNKRFFVLRKSNGLSMYKDHRSTKELTGHLGNPNYYPIEKESVQGSAFPFGLAVNCGKKKTQNYTLDAENNDVRELWIRAVSIYQKKGAERLSSVPKPLPDGNSEDAVVLSGYVMKSGAHGLEREYRKRYAVLRKSGFYYYEDHRILHNKFEAKPNEKKEIHMFIPYGSSYFPDNDTRFGVYDAHEDRTYQIDVPDSQSRDIWKMAIECVVAIHVKRPENFVPLFSVYQRATTG